MKKIYDLIIKNMAQGDIKKETAIRLLTLLRREYTDAQAEIAVIGMAAQLPYAADINEFWGNIVNRLDCIGEFPVNRRKTLHDYLFFDAGETMQDVGYLPGAYLDRVDSFDYKLFNIPPREASLMDPCQRLFLQTVWESLEDAGYCGRSHTGSRTGVYVGYNSNIDYKTMLSEVNPDALAGAVMGNKAPVLPSRMSHLFNWKGPALVLDTTCSSANVAVHLACQGLKLGECDMAIAAGVRINLLPLYDDNAEFGVTSSDSRIKAFDDDADGLGRGEGVISILLKPLSKARRDRDNIHAVIKSSAVNHDGTSFSLTAPNPASQRDVILKALQNAGINPETISYLEAHGTGTNLGDPLEMEGLEDAFKKYTTRKQFCALGSVKTNIGHLYECAGLAGLVKGIMALKSRTLPATINFNRPNRNIDFCNSPFYVNTTPRKWITTGHPRRCGVSSFGLSGTNCHIILEESSASSGESPVPGVDPRHKQGVVSGESAPEPVPGNADSGLQVFALSAKSETALQNLLARYRDFLNCRPDSSLEDICFTVNTGRWHHEYRLAFPAGDADDLKQKIDLLCKQGFPPDSVQWFFYGKHRLVKTARKDMSQGDITQGECDKLSRAVNSLIARNPGERKDDESTVREICLHYIRGAEVDWEALYRGENRRRLSLPLYPFDDNVCWFETAVPSPQQIQRKNIPGYYTMRWKPLAPGTAKPEGEGRSVVVFMDAGGAGGELAASLRSCRWNVIEVALGSGFEKADDNHFYINGLEESYFRLFSCLSAYKPERIVHMFTLPQQEEINNLAELDAQLESGLFSLFYILRALAKNGFSDSLDIVLISAYVNEITGKEPRINPAKAALFGLGKVVEKEFPGFKCRSIDLDRHTPLDVVPGELCASEPAEAVAYRRGKRYIEEFDKIDAEEEAGCRVTLSNEGVYVITGGAGGIGLEFARFLARHGKIRLALLNRTPIPDRKEWDSIRDLDTYKKLQRVIRVTQEIESTGSTVEFHAVDIADEHGLKIFLDRLRAQYGRINGIIHSAGISGEQSIAERQEEVFRQVLAPKIHGTWLLDRLTRADNPDFFVMFSSVATIFTMHGQGDYAAANAYLDAYAFYRSRLGKRTLTINWTTWKETGMAAESGHAIDTIFKTLPTVRAMEGFQGIINTPVKRVLIGDFNLKGPGLQLLVRSGIRLSVNIRRMMMRHPGIQKKNEGLPESGKVITGSSVKLRGRENGEYSRAEKWIAQVWGENLGIEEISIYDNYFDLGGDSILAVKAAQQLNKFTRKQVTQLDLLKYLTIPELAGYLEEIPVNTEGKLRNQYPQPGPLEKKDVYPASYAQQLMFMSFRMDGPDTSYNMSSVVTLECFINAGRLENAFRTLIDRHEVLRTAIELRGEEIVQRVHKDIVFRMETREATESALNEIIGNFKQPFDLGRPPLLRVGLVKLEKEKYVLLYDMPHVVTDGVSAQIFRDEFIQLYLGRDLPALRHQYKDYAVWQNRFMQSEAMREQEKYWLSVFKSKAPALNLVTDYPRPEVLTFEGRIISACLDPSVAEGISGISVETGSSLFVILLAAYNILLSHYTVQQDIIIGSPVAGRPLPEWKSLLGIFINTLPLRNYPAGEKSFKDFLLEVKEHTLQAFANQDYPLYELTKKLRLPRRLNRHPLFDTIFVLQNIAEKNHAKEGIEYSFDRTEHHISDYDLTLEAKPREKKIRFNLEYNTRLFKEKTAQRILKDYLGILKAITQNTHVKIMNIELESSVFPAPVYEKKEDVLFNL